MARQEGKEATSNELEVNVYDSFPQDWLNAEELEEQVARNLPQMIAKIPPFLNEEVKTTRTNSGWFKRESLRKALFGSSTFLLGVVCTLAISGSLTLERSNALQDQVAEQTTNAEVQREENELDYSDDSVVQFSSSQSYENSTSSNLFNASGEFGKLSTSASLNPQYDGLYASRPANFDANGPSAPNEYAPGQTFGDASSVEETAFPTWADLAPREEEINSQVATTSQDLNVPSSPLTEQGALQERFNVSPTPSASIQAQGSVPIQPNSAPQQFQAFSTGQSIPVQSGVPDYNGKNSYANVSSSKTLTNNANYVDVSQKNNYDSYQGNSDIFRQDLETPQVATAPSLPVEPEYEARNDAPLFQDRWSQNAPNAGQELNVPQVSESAPLYSEAIPTFDDPHPEAQNGANRQAYVAQHYEESSQQTPLPAARRTLRW